MSRVQGSVRDASGDRRGWNLMAVGAFLGVAIWAYALAPMEPASAMGATTGGTSGGTTGSSPGYLVTLGEDTGECWSTGAGPGYPRYYANGDTELNTNSHVVTIDSGGTESNPMPNADWGEADCAEEGSGFTASFAWQEGSGGTLPPDVLIVKVEVTATAIGTSPDVACDMPADYDFGAESAECVGVEWYVIENPGTTPDSITVTPTAYGAISEEYSGELESAQATLDYTVTCYNVRVTYEGVLDANTTSPKAMIGHAIRATVNLDGLSNAGATFD